MDRVDEVTKEVLGALGEVRAAAADGQTPPPEILHARMRAFLDRAMRRAAELGFPQGDVKDVGYVLAALVDERMVTLSPEVREHWVPRMMQLQLFNENVAGEGVFERIKALRADRSRMDVLRVYYLALLFGFQGKYRVRGGETELSAVIEQVAQTLADAGVIREAPLSPHGARPNERIARVRGSVSAPWMAAAAALLTISVVVILKLRIESRTDDLVDRIESAQRSDVER